MLTSPIPGAALCPFGFSSSGFSSHRCNFRVQLSHWENLKVKMSAEHLCDSTVSFAFEAHCYIIHGQTLSGSQPILFVFLLKEIYRKQRNPAI